MFDAELAHWVVTHPTHGPLYLNDAAKRAMDVFLAKESPPTQPAVLLLSGPVKSGKSMWLTEGLPGLLLARAARAPGARAPVFIYFSAGAGLTPEGYFYKLHTRVLEVAARYGVALRGLPLVATGAALSEAIRVLADALFARGCELVLLLDDMQAPMVARGAQLPAVNFAQRCCVCARPDGCDARWAGHGPGHCRPHVPRRSRRAASPGRVCVRRGRCCAADAR